ncbi:DUF11 domain-containing protein [Streptomyces himalayensis]|uniref:DUF11 domain-containing protein n=1 Tax=Streptomyces himalayensis subsp. himalayensis TaxID=2756131 RepID=A0A7W0DI80_9ACTN|nr:DUF11 domain-containing protein [Streptomyces himalayensis]MBA2945460.1 DUF11 domain-containing protein [Streptomyces himalayensis subsp. himalayensis]
MAMPTVFSDLLFAFRRRARRATGRQRSRNSRAGAVAVLSAVLVLFCPGVALAAPGDLDPTFDTDGKVTTDFAGRFDQANGVVVQPDGKIVTAGQSSTFAGGDFALARYNTDGSLDTSFDTDGRVTTDFGGNDGANGVVVQPDGKIVAAGFAATDGTDFALARYNTDGSLDTSFDTDGKVTTDFTLNGPANDVALGLALQDDGKIVAAGNSNSGGSIDFALARYDIDGSLDTDFDVDGKVTTDFAGGQDRANAVVVQADGRIVAAGQGESGGDGFDFALARYDIDGSLDTDFDADGTVTTDFGGTDNGRGVALQTDGKIVAAGTSDSGGSSDFALARYDIDGSLDTDFDADGTVTTDFGGTDNARGVVVQTDGKIVAAGTSDSGDGGDFALARYNSNGSLDTSFGTGGTVTTDFGGTDEAHAVALQTDGKIIAAGLSAPGEALDFALARYEGGVAPVGVDVSVTKTGPATVELGDQVSYTVTVTNNSTTDSATNVTLADTVTGPGQLVSATPSQGTCTTTSTSASCALGSLGPGASATVTVVVEPTATGTISDTATAQATEPDPEPDNNTDTATTTVEDAPPAGVDVSVTKTGPATAKLGQNISYTVTVTNNSTTDPATDVTLDDTLTGPGRLVSATPSQGTCTTTPTSASCALGILDSGASATVTVVVEPTARGTISDTATAQATEPDPEPDNNTDTATTTVKKKKCPPYDHKGCKKPGKPKPWDALVG